MFSTQIAILVKTALPVLDKEKPESDGYFDSVADGKQNNACLKRCSVILFVSGS